MAKVSCRVRLRLTGVSFRVGMLKMPPPAITPIKGMLYLGEIKSLDQDPGNCNSLTDFLVINIPILGLGLVLGLGLALVLALVYYG